MARNGFCWARLRFFGGMVGLLLVAAALRLSGVAWDGGIGAHPDERYVVGVSEGMVWPSRLNPFGIDPAFPYGHWPLYLFLLLGGSDRLMPARLLTGLLDVGTVALAAALTSLLSAERGTRSGTAGRRAAALGAALFLAVMPLHVQQAHFATADVPLTFFSTGALFFTARAALRGRAPRGVERYLAAIWTGLAMGCKAGAVLLLVPLTVSGVLGAREPRERVRGVIGALGAALATFAVTNPFAVGEFPRFLDNVAAQAALAHGAVLAPYTLQYRGTPPYLYPVIQQLAWGMGPVLGLLGLGGLVWMAGRAVRGPLSPPAWVVLVWAWPFFAFTAGLYVKFPRYLLPLTPILAAYAAQVLVSSRSAGRSVGGGLPFQVLCSLLALLAVLPAALLSTALVVSYHRPHPWVAASEGIRARLPPGSVIGVEEWDHPLPLDGGDYTLRALPVFAPDGEEKEGAMTAVLAEADAVVVASRRGYGALARWPDRFPRTLAYYRTLFAGEQEVVAVGCWGRWPTLVGISLADDPFGAAGLPLPHPDCRPAGVWLRLPHLDESFVVYDHPEVVLFIRSPRAFPK